ncbi:MAG: hypothetical protein H6R01_2025, partial [Burkholderiaceae bacterium]|nr:hypothetical protein [Burkholderiaceae bacterium]
ASLQQLPPLMQTDGDELGDGAPIDIRFLASGLRPDPNQTAIVFSDAENTKPDESC